MHQPSNQSNCTARVNQHNPHCSTISCSGAVHVIFRTHIILFDNRMYLSLLIMSGLILYCKKFMFILCKSYRGGVARYHDLIYFFFLTCLSKSFSFRLLERFKRENLRQMESVLAIMRKELNKRNKIKFLLSRHCQRPLYQVNNIQEN